MSMYTTYGAVFIEPAVKDGEPYWKVRFCVLPGERQYGCETMSAIGFYYYHFYEKTREQAFKALSNFMQKRHADEIDKLKKSLKSLEALEYRE